MNKLKKYRFSIVIPCYNEANFIADTLRSLKVQDTLQKYEIIVVDNNCTDETVNIAKQYGAKVVAERQAGICSARQAGTQAAIGEIVISTDADTTFSPNWLSTIDASFQNDKQLVAIGGPCRYIDGPWWGKLYTHFLFTGNYTYSRITGHPFYITATNIAFIKSAWPGYDPRITQGGDELDLLHKLRKQGKVRFDNANTTYTSGRRLTNGLIYNIFVSFLFYYLGAYYIDRIFQRTIIGSAPAFRKDSSLKISTELRVSLSLVFVSLLAISMSVAPLRSFMYDNLNDIASVIKDTLRSLS
ncbi:MAG TPA: glycosyltransferase family 2 protein [Candidatus Saccharimonadales bacterium]|nr:glycosyltransferase family 2 protein [Candidatus Saccharimonadales bacterium]